MNDSGGVEVGKLTFQSRPCPCAVTSINVCEAGLALRLAFSCLEVPSEPLSGCGPTEDIHERTKLLPTVCTYHLQLLDRQTAPRQTAPSLL